MLEDMVIAWLELAHGVVAEALRDVQFGYQGGTRVSVQEEKCQSLSQTNDCEYGFDIGARSGPSVIRK